MGQHHKFDIKSLEGLQQLADSLNIDIPISEKSDLLLEPAKIEGIKIPNRFVVQPMEGFDSRPDGSPGELAFRRYGRYARGGSGMIWFEATSVMQEGRSNPGQMMLNEGTAGAFEKLVNETRRIARSEFGSSFRPFLVLQLTHSGRFCKPGGILSGRYFSGNPHIDTGEHCRQRYTDDELEIIRDRFTDAIRLAEQAGFDSVDIKVSHGYLLNELLASYTAEGSRYGGDFERRTALIRELVNFPSGIVRSIRLNASDLIPYPYGFGMKTDGSPEYDLEEPARLIGELQEKVPLWNITAGIPYFNSYVNRPYDRGIKGSATPPEHPLEGVARLIGMTGELQQQFPHLPMVGSGYSWLRHFLPFVGAGVLDRRLASFIGLGRSSFAYPDAPRDIMMKGRMNPKKVCITCSRCTEFMRMGRFTGCAVRDKEIYHSKK